MADEATAEVDIESIGMEREAGKTVFLIISRDREEKVWIEEWLERRRHAVALYVVRDMDTFIPEQADVIYIGNVNVDNDGRLREGEAVRTVLRAAACGAAVMYRKEFESYAEIAELRALGGGTAICGKGSFARNADRLLFDVREREKRGRWGKEFTDEMRAKKIDCHPDNQSSVNLKI